MLTERSECVSDGGRCRTTTFVFSDGSFIDFVPKSLSLSLSVFSFFSVCVCLCFGCFHFLYKERKKERKVWLVLGNFFGIGFVIVWVRRLKEKNDGNMARGGPDLGLSWEGPWSFFFFFYLFIFLKVFWNKLLIWYFN